MEEAPNNNIAKEPIGFGKEHDMLDYNLGSLLGIESEIKIKNKDQVMNQLEELIQCFVSDITGAFKKDPAAKSVVEVMTSYPGMASRYAFKAWLSFACPMIGTNTFLLRISELVYGSPRGESTLTIL